MSNHPLSPDSETINIPHESSSSSKRLRLEYSGPPILDDGHACLKYDPELLQNGSLMRQLIKKAKENRQIAAVAAEHAEKCKIKAEQQHDIVMRTAFASEAEAAASHAEEAAKKAEEHRLIAKDATDAVKDIAEIAAVKETNDIAADTKGHFYRTIQFAAEARAAADDAMAEAIKKRKIVNEAQILNEAAKEAADKAAAAAVVANKEKEVAESTNISTKEAKKAADRATKAAEEAKAQSRLATVAADDAQTAATSTTSAEATASAEEAKQQQQRATQAAKSAEEAATAATMAVIAKQRKQSRIGVLISLGSFVIMTLFAGVLYYNPGGILSSLSSSTPTPTEVAVAILPTNTPVPVEPTPTATATNTSVPIEPTPTDTPVPIEPTPTATDTPVPIEPTPTDTPVPVEPTPTATDTPVPIEPTPTDTPVPVEPTPANTPSSGRTLIIGESAWAWFGDVNIREDHSQTSRIVATLAYGTKVTILDGPENAENYTWWLVQDEQGNQGWAADGDNQNAWFQLTAPPPP